MCINHRFAESIDLNVSDPVVHKHTPYVVILVKMAVQWAESHDGKLPSTSEEKNEFKVCRFCSIFICLLSCFITVIWFS